MELAGVVDLLEDVFGAFINLRLLGISSGGITVYWLKLKNWVCFFLFTATGLSVKFGGTHFNYHLKALVS